MNGYANTLQKKNDGMVIRTSPLMTQKYTLVH